MSESELERLVQGLDAVVWEAVGEPWAFTFVSDGAERLLGYPRAAWLEGSGFLRGLIHPEDRDTAVAATAAAARDRAGYTVEYRVTAAGGSMRWLRETGRADTAPDGRPRLRGLLVDVSTPARPQDGQARSDGAAQELDRLRELIEVKDSFLTAVSHELRTPLSAVLGIALTLQRSRARLPESVASELVGRLVGNARKLDQLLTDLLDLDRLQRGMLTPDRAATDLPALVRRVAEESGLTEERAVKIAAEPAVAWVDPAKTERILENLVTNTARHTPAGTPVWLRVWRERDGVVLAVEDAGPGVPAELRETVFEPFRRAGSSSPDGVGVGLSLVARFAELQGGRAWVQDRQGGGASFRVFLPAAYEPLPSGLRN